VENLGYIEHHEERRLLAETLALMDRGTEVIAQGALSDGEWFGRPDVLRRVEKRASSGLGRTKWQTRSWRERRKRRQSCNCRCTRILLKQIQGRCRSFCGWCRQARDTRAKNIRCSSMRRYYRAGAKAITEGSG